MSGSIAGGAVLLLKLGEALVEHLRELLRFVQLELFTEDVGFPLDGKLDATPINSDNCFGLGIPDACPDIPSEILQPRMAWSDPKRYDTVARDLCERFENNFKQFVDHVDKDVLAAGISAS